MIFIDQLNRQIELDAVPKRIISTVPSQTELLIDLGLSDYLVGRTKFCIHPKDTVSKIPKIGGTKNLKIDKIIELKPDLIIANKEENTKEDIELLATKFPVWISDIFNLKDALDSIKGIGQVTHSIESAQNLISNIKKEFQNIKKANTPQKVVYLIWQNPYISVGNDTFIHDMLEKMGWTNAFEDLSRYPEVSIDMIKDAHPDRILLSSEPYPFQAKHVSGFQSLFPKSQIQLVDGEYFSWYGSRLAHAPKYFKSIL